MGIGLGFLLAEIVSKHEMEWITTAKGSNPSKHTKGISVPPLDSKCLQECVIIVTNQLQHVSLQSLGTDESERCFKAGFRSEWKERFGNYRTDVFGYLELALNIINKSRKWKLPQKDEEMIRRQHEKMFEIGIVKEVAERFVSSARLLNGLNPPPARTNADVNQSVSAMVLAYDTCETS